MAFEPGDLFAIPIPDGRYVTGRIMLDVRRQCVEPSRIASDSNLMLFANGVLAEIYPGAMRHPSDERRPPLIPGVFTDREALAGQKWRIFAHREVDPASVEFPEALLMTGMLVHFVRGELSIPIPMSRAEMEHIGVYPMIQPSPALPNVCLFHMGLQHLIPHAYPGAMSLADSDLRFSRHRRRVYQLLKESEAQSYYEMALKRGLDLARFYR